MEEACFCRPMMARDSISKGTSPTLDGLSYGVAFPFSETRFNKFRLNRIGFLVTLDRKPWKLGSGLLGF